MSEIELSQKDDQLFCQYRLYVQMADKISERRQNANKFYIAMISSIFLFISVMINYGDSGEYLYYSIPFISGVGIAICTIWISNIESYRVLNRAKFRIIHELEESLPFPCYTKEQELLTKDNYVQLSRVEKVIPFIFIILFGFLIIFMMLIL